MRFTFRFFSCVAVVAMARFAAAQTADDAWIRALASGANNKPKVTAEIISSGPEYERVVNPPRITVQVSKVNLEAVTQAISQATRVPLICSDLKLFDEKKFTLNEENRTLWEVLLEMNRQHGVVVSGIKQYQYQTTTPAWKIMSPTNVDGFVVVPKMVQRQRSANPQTQELSPEKIQLSYDMVVDPRICVLRYTDPKIEQVTDENGLVLMPRSTVKMEPYFKDAGWHTGSFDGLLYFDLPPKTGKRIEYADGVAKVIALAAAEEVKIDDVSKRIGQKISIGGRTVTFEKLDLQPKDLSLAIAVDDGGKTAPDGGRGSGIIIQLIDANGIEVFSTVMRAARDTSSENRPFIAPIRARILLPTKVVVADLSFSLRALALP